MLNGSRELLFFLLLAVLLGGATAIAFTQSEAQRLAINEATTERRATTATLFAQLSDRAEIQTTTAQLQQSEDGFRPQLNRPTDPATVSNEITSALEREGLSAGSIGWLDQVNAAGFSQQRVRVSASGGFLQAYQFLSDLEQLPHLVRIKSMNIRRGMSGVSMELNLSFFNETTRGGK